MVVVVVVMVGGGCGGGGGSDGDGKFTLETLGEMTYRQVGREIIEKENGKK